MALQIEYDIHGVLLASAYLMVGDVILHRKDKTAEVFVYIYASKGERDTQQRLLTGSAIRKFVPGHLYAEFFETLIEDARAIIDPIEYEKMQIADILAWAAYRLLASYPEPVGMRELFELGEQI